MSTTYLGYKFPREILKYPKVLLVDIKFCRSSQNQYSVVDFSKYPTQITKGLKMTIISVKCILHTDLINIHKIIVTGGLIYMLDLVR